MVIIEEEAHGHFAYCLSYYEETVDLWYDNDTYFIFMVNIHYFIVIKMFI